MSNPYAKVMDELLKDPVKLKAFMRNVTGPERRTIIGDEYEQVMTLLLLTEPFNSSNNQRTSTDEYKLGGKIFHVTFVPWSDDPELEEIIEDDDETLT
jgi:hypothetical protein